MEKLIRKLAMAEQNFVKTKFIAPRLQGGKVLVRIQGLVMAYDPHPKEFEGWGVFRAESDEEAVLVESAGKSQSAGYLQLLVPVRLILLRPLKGQSWLAYPSHGDTFRRKIGEVKPVVVHLVTLGRAFEQAQCRWDGRAFWFEHSDRGSDPKIPSRMASALKAYLSPEALRFSGLTPELREAYRLIIKQEGDLRVRCGEARLRRALEFGGGKLESFIDRGDYWTTQWTTAGGERHTSAIHKEDLTVLSAGICLDGEDKKFDLQSLVGVVEQAY